ncbi:DNA polymerase Y family protein [Oceanirhabdus sp. W0125-5]|uniref:DNA polymerase Y family protein n=1 Tax=Oceanirhabdus sp. W0125-5 TaxID=2999116 RepID=UPI0022F329EA|nr:DNA polymerase IV [Oceanirhabdus sp. W0125-5]WBW98643.1 DNA polymerase IV [Oceanirhabdus sp. W0125-5]
MSYASFDNIKDNRYRNNKYEDDLFFKKNSKNRIIFHIDANSAFLSWEAVYRLQHGEDVDLREIPSVVGGDPKSRHGIVLAKSIPAKKYGIKTGESLMESRIKCPKLTVVPPRFHIYIKSSNAMFDIFSEYTPIIQRYSIDECFLDVSENEEAKKDPYALAIKIKERIKEELGFTVSIGVSNNKLLAKMGSELKKPDAATTLFPHEIENKLWPLPVRELFMVGRATEKKLKTIGINTIGELAQCEIGVLKERMKSHGELVWKYANGIDNSLVRRENYIEMKGLGNSTTISFDVDNKEEAHMVLMSLVETCSMRLRDSGNICKCITVSIRNSEFMNYSHQRVLSYETNCTDEIYKEVIRLFDDMWKGEAIRHLGIRLSHLSSAKNRQLTLFDYKDIKKKENLDSVIDDIRIKYGTGSVVRAKFIHSGLKPIRGGAGAESYPVMSSIL